MPSRVIGISLESVQAYVRDSVSATSNALFGSCLCTNLGYVTRGIFLDFSGIECISLGAISFDLTPWQRMIQASQKLRTIAEELISVSFISDESIIESIPMEILTKVHRQTSRTLLPLKYRQIVHDMKAGNFSLVAEAYEKITINQQTFQEEYEEKSLHIGMAFHNLAVAYLIAERHSEKEVNILHLFEEAAMIKRKKLGKFHPSLANTLNELGIQYYALEDYGQSLALFAEARSIYEYCGQSYNLKSWIVLNNMLCVHYAMRQITVAYNVLTDMRNIQRRTNAKVPLDVLHFATSLGNFAHICVQMKLYDIAIDVLEDVLILQESVLDEDDDTVQITRLNLAQCVPFITPNHQLV